MGLKSASGREAEEAGAGGLYRGFGAGHLVGGRLSQITMSPGFSVVVAPRGPRPGRCSRSSPGRTPWRLDAVGPQRANQGDGLPVAGGMGATSRSPRGARPRSRAILVCVLVSSMNTWRCGSSQGSRAPQIALRLYVRAVLFARMGVSCTPARGGGRHTVDGTVASRAGRGPGTTPPASDRAALDLGGQPVAWASIGPSRGRRLPVGPHRAGQPKKRVQLKRSSGSPEPVGHRPDRGTALDGGKNPLPKVDRVGADHDPSMNHSAPKKSQHRRAGKSPANSVRPESALGYRYYTCSHAAIKGKRACKGRSIPICVCWTRSCCLRSNRSS